MSEPASQQALEELRRRRRRERWKAFLTPLITMFSVVVAIGLFMSVMKACQKDSPQPAFNTPSSNPGARE